MNYYRLRGDRIGGVVAAETRPMAMLKMRHRLVGIERPEVERYVRGEWRPVVCGNVYCWGGNRMMKGFR